MSCMKTFRKGLLAVATGLIASAPAFAGGGQFGLNIDIQRSGLIDSVPTSSFGAAAEQPGTWNVVFANVNSAVSLLGLDGNPSGVVIQKTLGGTIGNENCVTGIVPQDWRRLMCDRQFNVAGVVNPIEYEVEGLPAGRYEIYTYSCDAGESFAPTHHVGVWVDNVYTGTANISGAVLTANFVEGSTHDRRLVTVDSGDAVRIRVFDSSGEFGDSVFFNGIQFKRIDGLVHAISEPAAQGCVEGIVDVVGTARGASFSSYRLEYSSNGSDPWMLISESGSTVSGDTLGTWDTTSLSEGYYTLRLTVQDAFGVSSTVVRTVYVNRVFDTVDVRSPVDDGIYGGKICFDGTVWDQCFDHYTVEYSPNGSPQYFDVDPGNPVYGSAVINDPLASWDASLLPDGMYDVRVNAETMGGATNGVEFPITIDNTPPTAVITDPSGCTFTCSDVVEISGTVFDEHISGWVLQYSDPVSNQWVTIASGNDNASGVLAEWDVSTLPGCCYAVRLIATDESVVNCGPQRWQTEYVTTVYLGNPLDANGNGQIDSGDLASLLAAWGPACP